MKAAEPASTGTLKSATITACPDEVGWAETAVETSMLSTANTIRPVKSNPNVIEKRKRFRDKVNSLLHSTV
jgi:hypothetical protein